MKAKVYILISEYVPEGREILGVFTNREQAKEAGDDYSCETSVEVHTVYGTENELLKT